MRFDLGRSCGAFFLWPFVCSLRVRSPLIPLQIGKQAIYNDIQLEIFNDIHNIYIYIERDDYNRRNHILYIHDIYMIYIYIYAYYVYETGESNLIRHTKQWMCHPGYWWFLGKPVGDVGQV